MKIKGYLPCSKWTFLYKTWCQSQNHDVRKPWFFCTVLLIKTHLCQHQSGIGDLEKAGTAGDRTVFSSVTREMISYIREQEQEESSGNSGEQHTERIHF